MEEEARKTNWFSWLPHLQQCTPTGGYPRACVLPNPSCCPPQARSRSSFQACQRKALQDTAASSRECLLALFTWVCQGLTPHLDFATTEARLGARKLSSSSLWVWSLSSTMQAVESTTSVLVPLFLGIVLCLHLSVGVYRNVKHLKLFLTLLQSDRDQVPSPSCSIRWLGRTRTGLSSISLSLSGQPGPLTIFFLVFSSLLQ